MIREGIRRGEKTRIVDMVGGRLEKIDSSLVYKAGLDGDKLALMVYEKVGRYLGIAIANVINLLNLEGVIIGGGVSRSWDLFIEALRKEVKERAFSYIADHIKIVKSELIDDAGILGASYLALRGIPC